ncbi:hypothetical protein ACLMJK_002792 [Lecanora helva]
MDPLSTFSLVCGIIQIIDFSTKALSKCKEIYEDGSLHDYEELEDITKRLTNLNIDLQPPGDAKTPGNVGAPDRSALLDIARQCSDTANSLIKEFQALKIEGPHRKRQAVRKGFQAAWKTKGIQDAQKKLAGYQDVLNTKILVDLRREENIKDAHKKTFEWIFDRADEGVRPWSNFVRWLETGQGTYWIHGKAGSGKSTLMNFLCQDSRMMQSLQVWAGSKAISITKFFFWNSGTAMEKSVMGLLRSLLWQLMQELPEAEFDEVLMQSGIRPKSIDGFFTRSDGILAWTQRRLLVFLNTTIQHSLSHHRLCFFIDGLDEFNLGEITDVKLCLSSRPYREFDLAFGESAKLRLQDLTSQDIKKFVTDKITSAASRQSISYKNPNQWQSIITQVVRKAQGVFLWVSIAVKDQIHGLRNGDSLDQLEARLGALPDEVEGVYIHMLERIEKPYQKEASQFMLMTLEGRTSLIDLALDSLANLDDLLDLEKPIAVSSLVVRSQLIRCRINTICAGLLEIFDARLNYREASPARTPYTSDGVRGEVADSDLEALGFKSEIAFTHLTAVDFLENSEHGQTLLKKHYPDKSDLLCHKIKSELIQSRLRGWTSQHDVMERVDHIFLQIRRMEELTGVAQKRISKLVDLTISQLDKRYLRRRLDSHWSTRWSKLGYLYDVWNVSNDKFFNFEEWSEDPIKERGFLSCAAAYGLAHYVQRELDHSRGQQDPNLVNDILYYSVFCVVSQYQSDFIRGGLSILANALKQGGNPNMAPNNGVAESTLWTRFLSKFHYHFHQCERPYRSWSHKSDYDDHELMQLLKAYAEVIQICIECGADVTTSIKFHVTGWSLRMEKTSECCWFNFKFQISPLAIMELSLENSPEMSHIRQLCNARGGSSLVRCARFTCSRNSGLATGSRSYKLSEHESVMFRDVYQNSNLPFDRRKRQLIGLGQGLRQELEASE